MVNRYPQNTNQRRVFDFYLDLKKCWQRRSSWWWRVGHAGLFISRATTAYAFNIFHCEVFWAQCRGWGPWLPRHMLSLRFPLLCCVWPQDFWAQCSFHDCGLHSDTTEHFSSELDITIQRDTDQPEIRSSVHDQSLEPLLHYRSCVNPTRGVPSVKQLQCVVFGLRMRRRQDISFHSALKISLRWSSVPCLEQPASRFPILLQIKTNLFLPGNCRCKNIFPWN